MRFDLSVRAAGVALLACAALAIALLARLACARPPHDATPIEMLLAAIGFVNASVGAAGLAIGRGLFAPVPLPPRWRPH